MAIVSVSLSLLLLLLLLLLQKYVFRVALSHEIAAGPM